MHAPNPGDENGRDPPKYPTTRRRSQPRAPGGNRRGPASRRGRAAEEADEPPVGQEEPNGVTRFVARIRFMSWVMVISVVTRAPVPSYGDAGV